MRVAQAVPWLVWIEQSPVGEFMRASSWAYPAVETVHILGFVVLVGGAFLFDLRLLGLGRTLPLSELARHLLGWSRASVLVVVPAGLLLFASDATGLALSPVFRLKLTLIAAAAVNAGVFHLFTFPSVRGWDRDAPTPVPARLAALLSIGLWTGVIICGRLLAYL